MTPELFKYNLEMARMMQELRIHGLEDIKYIGDKALKNCAAVMEDLAGVLVVEEEK
jgi:hypothetical protein